MLGGAFKHLRDFARVLFDTAESKYSGSRAVYHCVTITSVVLLEKVVRSHVIHEKARESFRTFDVLQNIQAGLENAQERSKKPA